MPSHLGWKADAGFVSLSKLEAFVSANEAAVKAALDGLRKMGDLSSASPASFYSGVSAIQQLQEVLSWSTPIVDSVAKSLGRIENLAATNGGEIKMAAASFSKLERLMSDNQAWFRSLVSNVSAIARILNQHGTNLKGLGDVILKVFLFEVIASIISITTFIYAFRSKANSSSSMSRAAISLHYQDKFAEHVHHFATSKIKAAGANNLDTTKGPGFFVLYHPATDWHASFDQLPRISEVVHRTHNLDTLLRRVNSMRSLYGAKTVIHILFPSAHSYTISDMGILLSKSPTGPLVLEGELDHLGKSYVTVQSSPYFHGAVFDQVGKLSAQILPREIIWALRLGLLMMMLGSLTSVDNVANIGVLMIVLVCGLGLGLTFLY